ncbi:hypothetical protein [Lysinibacter sp. HNR]|uniref:hypothetical protein n=1 Tax=Lysinibacter sp. HNR TaxID=3031408 RepID=UPI0024349D8E|nr:hypothetical protein [Lysinibacter sp. HNR]WGD37564.1 hypothetical protein FrondiHNR_01170 [Lysinibacter sp. HNR]
MKIMQRKPSEFDETVGGIRLSELAALKSRWDGNAAAQISSAALETARIFLQSTEKMKIKHPGVFPTEEGGVLIEWADSSSVHSIEVFNGGRFETFSLRAGIDSKLEED